MKNKKKLPRWVVLPVVFLLKLWHLSCRSVNAGLADALSVETFPAIFVIWHNRIPLVGGFLQKEMRGRISVMISASRDGNYISDIIRYFGFRVVRGSSSRGGARALRGLLDELEAGNATVVTVDGPRGPRYKAHPGVALLARKTGLPVIPISVNAPRRWEAKSWDRSQLPKPFSKIELHAGEALHIPADMDGEEACRLIEEALMAITDDSRV